MSARCLRCGAGNEWIEGKATHSADLERQLAAERAKPCPHVYSGSDGTSHCTLAQADAEARAYAEKKEADLFAEVIAQQYRADTAEAQLAAEREVKDACGRELQQVYAELRAEREAGNRMVREVERYEFRLAEAVAILAELIAASDQSVNCATGSDDDVAAMLRFGKADAAARALLSESTARQESISEGRKGEG